MQKLHIANDDKPIEFYNLDVIISDGYRVNSKRGTQFRQWATQRPKDYLVQLYALNQKRLDECCPPLIAPMTFWGKFAFRFSAGLSIGR